jgi:hypothetical protein
VPTCIFACSSTTVTSICPILISSELEEKGRIKVKLQLKSNLHIRCADMHLVTDNSGSRNIIL